MTNWLLHSVSFDKDASRYNADVYKRKREEFLEKLTSTLHINYIEQLRNLHKRGIVQFSKSLQVRQWGALLHPELRLISFFELQEKLKSGDGQFAAILRTSREEAEATFRDVAVKSRIKYADWSYEEFLSQFQDALEEIANAKRGEALQRMVSSLQVCMLFCNSFSNISWSSYCPFALENDFGWTE